MDTTTTKEQILDIIKEIRKSKVPNKEEYFATIYQSFKDKYPVLFKMACTINDMDISTLEYMLDMLQKIKNNNMTQYDASADVGKKLYDKYIHDNIKDLPPTKKT
jgi:hypothetical protein